MNHASDCISALSLLKLHLQEAWLEKPTLYMEGSKDFFQLEELKNKAPARKKVPRHHALVEKEQDSSPPPTPPSTLPLSPPLPPPKAVKAPSKNSSKEPSWSSEEMKRLILKTGLPVQFVQAPSNVKKRAVIICSEKSPFLHHVAKTLEVYNLSVEIKVESTLQVKLLVYEGEVLVEEADLKDPITPDEKKALWLKFHDHLH